MKQKIPYSKKILHLIKISKLSIFQGLIHEINAIALQSLENLQHKLLTMFCNNYNYEKYFISFLYVSKII